MYEREVALLLNVYDLAEHGVVSMLSEPFNADDWTLSQLLKEVKKRGAPPDLFQVLDDGKGARNELVHRLIGPGYLISTVDKEMFIDRIAGLYYRIWRALKVATDLRIQYCEEVGFSEEKQQEKLRRMKEEARIEDEFIKRILNDTQKEDEG